MKQGLLIASRTLKRDCRQRQLGARVGVFGPDFAEHLDAVRSESHHNNGRTLPMPRVERMMRGSSCPTKKSKCRQEFRRQLAPQT